MTMTMAEKINEGNIPSKDVRIVVVLSSTLFALLVGVFMVGWNARGQTAYIQAVEAKTIVLGKSFGDHRTMFFEYKRNRDAELAIMKEGWIKLKEASIVNTSLLESIDKRLEVINKKIESR